MRLDNASSHFSNALISVWHQPILCNVMRRKDCFVLFPEILYDRSSASNRGCMITENSGMQVRNHCIADVNCNSSLAMVGVAMFSKSDTWRGSYLKRSAEIFLPHHVIEFLKSRHFDGCNLKLTATQKSKMFVMYCKSSSPFFRCNGKAIANFDVKVVASTYA